MKIKKTLLELPHLLKVALVMGLWYLCVGFCKLIKKEIP